MKSKSKTPRKERVGKSGNHTPRKKGKSEKPVITDELRSEIDLLQPDENSLDRG